MIRQARSRPVEVKYITFEDFDKMYTDFKNAEIIDEPNQTFDSIKHRTKKWFKPIVFYKINIFKGWIQFTKKDILVITNSEIEVLRIKDFNMKYRRLS